MAELTNNSQLLAQSKQSKQACKTCRLFSGKMLPWVGSQDAEVLFLVDYPRGEDPVKGSFNGDAGATFKKLLHMTMQQYPPEHPVRTLKIRLGYAMQCGIADRELQKKIKPTASDIGACSWVRDQRIRGLSKLQMIIPMGKLATASLGVKESNFDNVRGKELEVTVEGETYRCIPTFHPTAIYMGSGLTKIFLNELRSILEIAALSAIADGTTLLDEISKYEYPSSAAEVKDLVERIISYGGDKHPIAFDTETNSLEMHLRTSKCIAFSVAWDKRLSAAWLMNHKEAPPGEWWYMLPYVFNLLMSQKPKIAHNFQFDLRVVRHLVRALQQLLLTIDGYVEFFTKECHYSVEEIVADDGIRNISWDTMLAEHALEEDKKGYYSLKSIIRKYEPKFIGYERTLKEAAGAGGHKIKLRTLADYIAHIAGSPEIANIRKSTETFTGWMRTYHPNTTMPAFIKTFIQDNQLQAMNVLEVRDFIMKSKKKRDATNDIKKNSNPAQESKIFIEWFDWFKVEAKRDQLRAKIKEMAKDMKELVEKDRSDVNFENYPVTELLTYAAIDPDMTISSALSQIKELRREESERPSLHYFNGVKETSISAMKKISLPMTVALSKMVDKGVKLDYEYLEHLERTYTKQAIDSESRLFELAGVPDKILAGTQLNINSAGHAALLLQKCNFQLTERTDTGQIKVSKDVLKKLYKEAPDSNPCKEAPMLLLRYRESLKARDTFLKNFRKYAESDGRIHPSFHQIGTSSYRLSSSHPNFQNIPKKLAGYNIKECLIPSNSDMVIVNIDAAGAEIKSLTAYLAALTGLNRGEQLIRDMNTDPKFDMHSKFCAYIFGPKLFNLDVSTPEAWEASYKFIRSNKDDNAAISNARTKVKAVVFGTLYGQTEHGLANLLQISVEEARFIIEQFFAADPSIQDYVNWSQEIVAMSGYITTILGRRRRFPLCRLDIKQLRRAKRQGTNFLIQSLTVDIFNYLISKFIPTLLELGGSPLMQVHDALVFELPKIHVSKLPDIVTNLFENRVAQDFTWFPVPFKCDVEVGNSYGTLCRVSKYLEEMGAKNIPVSEIVVPITTVEDDVENDLVDPRLQTELDDPDEAHTVVIDTIFEDGDVV